MLPITVTAVNRRQARHLLADKSDICRARHAYVRVELEDDILHLARDLIQRRPSRGYDTVHLTSALRLKIGLGEEITFAAADERLLKQAEKLQFLNVETARVS